MKRIALPFPEGFLFLCLLIMGCGPEAVSSPPDEVNEEQTADLQVTVPAGRLRAEPSPDGVIVQQLAQGTYLFDLGVVSSHTTVIRFGDRQYDEPWLQVRDPNGNTGWIYAGEVVPNGAGVSVALFREQKQLVSIFGPEVFQQLEDYQQGWAQAGTDAGLATIYERGLRFRDTLNSLMEQRTDQYTRDPIPDLFWIDRYIPGYVAQLVAEGSSYYLFNDYEAWLNSARQTRGRQDEQFFELMVHCFPEDSVEYFYPAWELQTWDYGGHHLLGRGIARNILARIARIKPQTPLFAAQLNTIKDQIVTSITQADIHFWEPDSLVKRELDSIIQANWSIFTPTDRIALNTRRMQLDSPRIYEIRFNARSGE